MPVRTELDEASFAELNADPWMREVLELNPSYVLWGPGESYMRLPEVDAGWERGIAYDRWSDFDIKLNELNEVVNFHFQVIRASKPCAPCGGAGWGPAATLLNETFHGGWSTKLEQEDVDELVSHKRLIDFTHVFESGKGWQPKDPPHRPTAEEVNARDAVGPHRASVHDAINRHILVRFRATKMGAPAECEVCKGNGDVWTADKAHVELVLWLLHPRKGASRGVTIGRIEKHELPKALTFLAEAAARNTARFQKVIDLSAR